MAEQLHYIDRLQSPPSQSKPPLPAPTSQQRGSYSQIPFRGSRSDQQRPDNESSANPTVRDDLPYEGASKISPSCDADQLSKSHEASVQNGIKWQLQQCKIKQRKIESQLQQYEIKQRDIQEQHEIVRLKIKGVAERREIERREIEGLIERREIKWREIKWREVKWRELKRRKTAGREIEGKIKRLEIERQHLIERQCAIEQLEIQQLEIEGKIKRLEIGRQDLIERQRAIEQRASNRTKSVLAALIPRYILTPALENLAGTAAADWMAGIENGGRRARRQSIRPIAQEAWKEVTSSEDRPEVGPKHQWPFQYERPSIHADSSSSVGTKTSQLNLEPAGLRKISSKEGRSSLKHTKLKKANVSVSKDCTKSTLARGGLTRHRFQDQAGISGSAVGVPGAEVSKFEAGIDAQATMALENLVKLEASTSASSSACSPSDGELSFIAADETDHGSLANSQDAGNDIAEVQSMLVAGMVQQYMKAAGDCGFRCKAQSESHASSSSSTEPPSRHPSSTKTLQTAVSRRKRARANGNGGDDDDNDGSERRKSKRKQQQCSDSDYVPEKLFACPFSKHDPSRYSERNIVEKNYRGCSSCFLKDISRVKQHLYRLHKRPDHYCGSCFQCFETQEALDDHSRQRPACELAESRFSEKMTRDQLNSIKRRSPGKDACETWFNIFRVLFPGATIPDSPYCEAASPTAVQSFSQRFLARAPAMLSALVRTRIQGRVLMTNEEQQILDSALEDSLSEVVQQFETDFDEVEAAITAQSAVESDHAGPSQPILASREGSYDNAAQTHTPSFSGPAPAQTSIFDDYFMNFEEDHSDDEV